MATKAPALLVGVMLAGISTCSNSKEDAVAGDDHEKTCAMRKLTRRPHCVAYVGMCALILVLLVVCIKIISTLFSFFQQTCEFDYKLPLTRKKRRKGRHASRATIIGSTSSVKSITSSFYPLKDVNLNETLMNKNMNMNMKYKQSGKDTNGLEADSCSAVNKAEGGDLQFLDDYKTVCGIEGRSSSDLKVCLLVDGTTRFC